MTELQSRYLTVRSGRYYFRRRIRGLSTKTKPMTLSMGTTDRESAFIWLGRLVVEFDHMLDRFLLLQPELPEPLVERYMQVRLRQTLHMMNRQCRIARMTGRTLWPEGQTPELMKFVLQVLLEDGVVRNFPEHRIDPTWSPDQLEAVLQLYAKEYRRITSPELDEMMQREFVEMSHIEARGLEHKAQLREASLKARIAALSGEVPAFDGALPTPRPAVETAAMSSEPESENPRPVAVPQAAPEAPRPITQGVELIEGQLTIAALMAQFDQAKAQEGSDTTHYGRDLAGIFWRMAVHDGLSAEVAKQRASDLRLFCFVTGVQTIDQVEQSHLRRYSDALKEIPKNFLRSCYDQNRSFAQVKEMARAMSRSEVGLAAGTVKRHLKTLELTIARAQSEGHELKVTPDFKALRPKVKGKAHKRRSVFTLREVQTLFKHSVWQGHRSWGRRHESGDVLRKDGRYWIPLILAYTGARRAEIAGLLPGDIGLIDGIPAITIQSHKWRGIKGEDPDATSPQEKLTRYVPIHSHLIELGLMDHVQAMRDNGETFLFPDVIPKPRNGSPLPPVDELNVDKFGDAIDYTWRKSLEIALNGNPRKLCLHSLRHYVNNTLIHAEGVHEVTRFDIVGHVSDDDEDDRKTAVNTSTYRDDTPMAIKVVAIEKLERLF